MADTEEAGIQINSSEIQATYEQLWGQAVPSIETNSVKVDPILRNKADDLRIGLTLICRPSSHVQDGIMRFLEEVRKMEPEQYYYQSTELHTTVLGIVTCTVEFNPSTADTPPYIEVLKQSVASIPAFNIRYRGITASRDSVMIQGFPQDATLQQIRHNIRENFRRSGVKTTLDQRFKTHTAHITCLRFQDPVLHHPNNFLALLKRYRAFDFGTSEMTELEFVVNDWYMSVGKVDVLQRFALGTG